MKNTACYLRLLLRDGEARRGAVSFIGMLVNSAYAVWCLIVGILFSNSWLIAVAAFYALTPIVRFLSISGAPSTLNKRAVSRLLLYVSAAISGMMLRLVVLEEAPSYPRGSEFVFLFYAVFGLLSASLRLSRKAEKGYRLTSALRLSTALISIFNLHSPLLSYFNITGAVRIAVGLTLSAVSSLSLFYLAKRSEIGY